MDPIEKLNSMRKTNTKDFPGKSETLKGLNSQSQENFFKKTGKSFNLSKADAYGTIIQIMKSDIFQIQEMINDFSHVTKIFKLSSRISATSKKLSEIEESKDVKTLIDKITDDSSSIDKLGKIYSCPNPNDLIGKIALELNLYETFIKKINELFYILNLKFNGDENSSNISQQSFSKFYVIKLVLDKMMENTSNKYTNDTDTSININSLNNSQTNFKLDKNNNELLNISTNLIDNETNKKFEEYEKIKLTNNISNLLYRDQVEEPLINHISNLIKDFLGKLSVGYSDLINKFSGKKDNINLNLNTNITIENLFSQKLMIEKLLVEKEKNLNAAAACDCNKYIPEKKNLEMEIENLKTINKKNINEIKNISDKINEQKLKFEEEISKLKNLLNSKDKNTSNKTKENNSPNLESFNLYTIDESNNFYNKSKFLDFINQNFQQAIQKNSSKLYEEVK